MAPEYTTTIPGLAEANTDLGFLRDSSNTFPHPARTACARAASIQCSRRRKAWHKRPHEQWQMTPNAQRRAHQVVHLLRHQLHVKHPDAVPGETEEDYRMQRAAGAKDRAPATAWGIVGARHRGFAMFTETRNTIQSANSSWGLPC